MSEKLCPRKLDEARMRYMSLPQQAGMIPGAIATMEAVPSVDTTCNTDCPGPNDVERARFSPLRVILGPTFEECPLSPQETSVDIQPSEQ